MPEGVPFRESATKAAREDPRSRVASSGGPTIAKRFEKGKQNKLRKGISRTKILKDVCEIVNVPERDVHVTNAGGTFLKES